MGAALKGEIYKRLARRANEIPKHSHVGTVSPDASGIHGKSEPLGKIQIHASVVQFRQAENLVQAAHD